MTEVLVKVGFLAIAALNGAIIFTIMDVKGLMGAAKTGSFTCRT